MSKQAKSNAFETHPNGTANEILRLQVERLDLLEALKKSLEALKIANDIGDGPIHDTIWMPSGTETLFDYMGSAIAKAEGKA